MKNYPLSANQYFVIFHCCLTGNCKQIFIMLVKRMDNKPTEKYNTELKTRRLTDFTQVEMLYKTRLKKDFARNELKPLSSMRRFWEKDAYVCYGLFSASGKTICLTTLALQKDAGIRDSVPFSCDSLPNALQRQTVLSVKWKIRIKRRMRRHAHCGRGDFSSISAADISKPS